MDKSELVYPIVVYLYTIIYRYAIIVAQTFII